MRTIPTIAAAIVAASVLLSLGASPPAQAAETSASVTASADTYTNSSAPTTNYGQSSSLAVYGTPSITPVLRFLLPPAPAGSALTGVTLRIHTTTLASAGSNASATVRVASDDWTETGTTYGDRPTLGATVLGTLPGGTAPNNPYAVTLDPAGLAASVGGPVTLALQSTGTDSMWLWSRQAASSGNRPVLDLTFSTATPPEPSGDPLPLAPAADVPVVTASPLATAASPTIPQSSGWLREKRVGVAESAAGVAQRSTAPLDLTGSTRFRYGGVPAAPGFAGNPSQFVVTTLKPGGAPQSAYWLFAVEFVLSGTSQVEFRINATTTNPTFGLILVNGKRIQETASTITASAGATTSVRLTFPSNERRVIKVLGLNHNQGRFGGVAVGPGGTVTKPDVAATRTVAVISDSFGNGAGAPPTGARSTETFAWRLAMLLGADEVVQAGIGGTGFVRTIGSLPESTFQGRVPTVLAMQPDVLILAGGRNDTATGLQAAVAASLDSTTAVPERYVLPTTSASQVSSTAAIKAGADSRGVPFLDIDRAGYAIGPDRVHPTFEGHKTLADLAYAAIRATP